MSGLGEMGRLQKQLSEDWAPVIQQLLRRYVAEAAVVVRAATTSEDYHGADYVVSIPQPAGCGARVRNDWPGKRWYRDLTVRVRGPNGGASEYFRMRQGQTPGWYCVLWVGPYDKALHAWAVLDMAPVYASGILDGLLAHRHKPNKDGTTFTWLTARELLECGSVLGTSGLEVD